MKLLVLVNHFAPDRGGGGATYTDMCYGLAERGVEVTAACPVPFYPEWRDKSGRNGLKLWRYRDRGVEVVRYGLFIPKKPRSFAQRIAFELSLLVSALRLVPAARKADAVMVYCPNFGMVVVGAIIRMLWGKPCWLNVQDVMSDAARNTGMLRSSAIARALSAIESFFFNRYSLWSTISPVMMERLAPMRRRGQDLLLLPNWLDGDLRAELAARGLRERPQGAAPRLLYAGNISGKQDLLRFCEKLSRSDLGFSFRIFGNGGEAETVRRWVEECGDPRFSFGGFLNAAQLAEELASTDFCVITEKEGSGASFFPSKYVGAIAAGAPILAICDPGGPLGSEMAKAQAGALLSWSELDALPDIFRRLTGDGAEWSAWRRNALARAEAFDRDRLLDDLVVQLEALRRKNR